MSNRYLPTSLRRALEKAVKDARIVAEEGACDAIRRLGVADSKAPTYLSDPEKELRRRLRAHARALGDAFDRNDNGQETKHLIESAAYANWHRMLFARFLAERGLLRHPEHDVPVSLEDCRELAAEEGLDDEWAVAERYSAAMLPAVFRMDDPVLELELDPVHTQKLNGLVTTLDAEIFQGEDSLGWTYQFWRASEKDAVNKSGVKIGADEIPAVTQLFTEPYMVQFLLHNTLGAWWAGKVLAADPNLAANAEDENALRSACALPGYNFDMLRFVREGTNDPWQPAAGTFPGWPTEVKDITLLDPCCGSGHFLTEALAILAALRKTEEGLSSSDAVTTVLRDNLHGLEIDGRCVQIAAFAVGLTAWRIGGWQILPLPHIAWVGAPPPLPKREFVALAEGDPELEYALEALHDLFAQAPLLGSLLDPSGGDLFEAEKMREIERLLDPLLNKVRRAEPEWAEGVVAARGMADGASILNERYTLQTTNVPFLNQSKFGEELKTYIYRNYTLGKENIATAFLLKMLNMAKDDGTIAFVSPQSWWFLKRYTEMRKDILCNQEIPFLVRLGENAFWSPQAGGELVGLSVLSKTNGKNTNPISLLDTSSSDEHDQKAHLISKNAVKRNKKSDYISDGSYIFYFDKISFKDKISDFCSALQGCVTGDSPRFLAKFWEHVSIGQSWELLQTTSPSTQSFGGMTDAYFYEKEQGQLAELAESVKGINHSAQNWRKGKPNWGKRGVVVSQMGSFPSSLYMGNIYDHNCCAIVPSDEKYLPALWSFVQSNEFVNSIKAINQNRKVEVGTLLNVQFDLKRWEHIGSEAYPNGLPEPYSADPTQWIFHGHPAKAIESTALHVALARLCGYRWPAETDISMRLSDEARHWVGEAAALPRGDNDGLVGVPAVAGEKPLADRLRAYLSTAHGAEWSDSLERRLVAEADEMLDKKAARDGSLETWVRDRAFRQHCALFGQRPFLWHISDGLKDGFSVFVHYHRFNQANLRKLTYTLLGDWLARAKAEDNSLRYEKGRELQQALEKVLEGEIPFDIFVRWKSLAQQPLGWDPDLDDGVRQNIRPFIKAGVLSHNLLKIFKAKDRGSDLASAPWYPLFKGERINDHHTTLAEKQAARDAAKQRVEATK